ncbi:MAG: hypothetical protein EBT08_17955 [Betaproteobacteria bacterium]|nr:hypothetical protein [Betaproteobacteria bacterium]
MGGGSAQMIGRPVPRNSALSPDFADDLLTFSAEVRRSGFSDFGDFLSVFSQLGFVGKGVLVVCSK